MSEQIEIRLSGGGDPSGEIDLAVLGPLSSALADFSTRIARWRADRAGPGRTPSTLRGLSQLRLRGVEHGSTVLAVQRASDEYLDFDDELSVDVQEQFWRLLGVIGRGAVDPDLPDLLRETVASLIDALSAAGTDVTVRSRSHAERMVTIHPRELDRERWLEPRQHLKDDSAVFGLLEMVDIKSRRFRIRDDVGNSIALEQVVDVDAAATLVASRVRAEGSLWSRRGVPLLRGVTIVAAEPVVLGGGVTGDWDREMAKVGPEPVDWELSDEEFESFLLAARSG